jgi:hypothetical protein
MAASKRPRVTLSTLDRRMSGLDDRMHTLDQRMDGLDHRVQDLGDRMRGQGIILEEIRAQNRATIEAVVAFRVALEAKIDQADRDSQARDAVLCLLALTTRVDALGRVT